jgi:hypothetical protein
MLKILINIDFDVKMNFKKWGKLKVQKTFLTCIYLFSRGPSPSKPASKEYNGVRLGVSLFSYSGWTFTTLQIACSAVEYKKYLTFNILCTERTALPKGKRFE